MSLDNFNLKNAQYGFTTYKNYLLALSYLIDLTFPNYSMLVNSLKNIQPRHNINEHRVRSLLLNSWNSELLLNLPNLFQEDFLKFSNHWSPVQSYYSIYLGCRALIVAKNINARGDHATTCRVVVSNLIQGENLFPQPWGILMDGQGFKNLNNYTSPHSINPLENPHYFRNDPDKLWDSLCLFIRTTRYRIIEEKCQEWKDRHPTNKGARKRLPSGKKVKIAYSTQPTSLFDCFYRLRIRSNYKDVDIFILGSSAPETRYYFNALCNITDKTLFVIESYLCRYLGRKKIFTIINDYLQNDTLGISKSLKYSINNRFKYYGQ